MFSEIYHGLILPLVKNTNIISSNIYFQGNRNHHNSVGGYLKLLSRNFSMTLHGFSLSFLPIKHVSKIFVQLD